MDDFPVDVSHLRPVKTARFKLGFRVNEFSAPHIILTGKHAGRENAAFVNAIMKIEGEYNAGMTGAQLDAADERRAEIFARTVFTGWEGPCTRDGKPAAYSVERFMMVARGLIAQNRPDALQVVFRFFQDADNFTESAQTSEALGKE